MSRIEHYATYLIGGAGMAALRIFDGICDQIDSARNLQETSPRFPATDRPTQPAKTPDEPAAEQTRLDSSIADWELEFLCRSDQPLIGQRRSHFVPSQSFFDRTWARRWNRSSFRLAKRHWLKHLQNRPPQHEVFSPARLYEPTARSRQKPVSLVHLHWVAFLFDLPSFFGSIPATTPIVWTLHDMNAFTGGCHYSAGCDRYQSGCGSCFQLDSPHSQDLSAISCEQKQNAYRNHNMTVVAPCRWLTDLASGSGMFPANTRFETIHYGLDVSAFQPSERNSAKSQLGLDPQKITLLFGAADLGVPRKGIEPLAEALRCLASPEEYQVAIFGGGKGADSLLEGLDGRMEVVHLGYLETTQQKCSAYSAADIFLLPSLEDNQPQTGLEALACGTPVIAFDTGGIPEFVQHGKTGLLTQVGDAKGLAKQIRWLSQSPDARFTFGQNGRLLVENEYEIQKQTRAYLQLYDHLLQAGQQLRRRAG